MRGPIRGIGYAAVAGVVMVLFSLASVPAQAQRVPGGSYLRSCTNVGVFGNRLVAECRRKDGRWRRTALDLSGCAGGIANINGRLTCSPAGPGFGSSWNRWGR
jgi:CVNH domain